MNKILTISSIIFAAIGLLDGIVTTMAGSVIMGTGFLVFASFLLMPKKH